MLIDVRPIAGGAETVEYDPATREMIITRRTDVSGLLDANAAAYNDTDAHRRGIKAGMHHVARVDFEDLWDWLQEFNAGKPVADTLHSPFFPNPEWERFLYRRLNCSDFRKFRTAPGNI